MKRTYVAAVRALRPVADRIGLLAWLDHRRARSRTARWARSLFTIHDDEEMIGLDLPWWNLKAIDVVDEFLRTKNRPRAFEYGSGASTTWLARRCFEVISVEHDLGWGERVRAQTRNLDNVEVLIVPPKQKDCHGAKGIRSQRPGADGDFSEYVGTIDDCEGSFDLIVIDGRCRCECLSAARRKLKDDGLIVFDNSARSRYSKCLKASHLKIEKYLGLSACLPYPDSTSLLFHERAETGMLENQL